MDDAFVKIEFVEFGGGYGNANSLISRSGEMDSVGGKRPT
jgi:hypothetical protein